MFKNKVKFSEFSNNINTLLHYKKATQFLLLTSILCLVACKMDKKTNLPDISDVNVALEIERFDQDLFNLDTSKATFNGEVGNMINKYPVFFPFYHETLMEWNAPSPIFDANTNAIKDFIHNKDIRGVYDSIQAIYPDNAKIEEYLLPALKYYKYYFPDKSTPKIVAYLSAFRQQGLTLDTSIIGLGLDMHLGRDYLFYETVNYPLYIQREFAPEYLATHAMKVWSQQLYPNPSRRNRLLDQMVYNGKLLYFLDLVLPEVHDSIKLGYTSEQIEWCENNESEIWSYLIDRKLLYESERTKYAPLVSPGPTTMGMPSRSPGSVGNWVGLQIVRKYMEENPELDFNTMFEEQNGQEFLKGAKYKPKRPE